MKYTTTMVARGIDALVAFLSIAGGVVRLFKNEVVPTDAIDGSYLEEADFSGYAAGTVPVFGGAYRNSEEQLQRLSQRYQFDHNGGPVANSIWGFLIETAEGNVMVVHKFEVPVPMATADHAVNFVLAVRGEPTGAVFQED